MAIPYKEFDMLISDVDERELTQIGFTNDLEHLSVASFPSSSFPATGQIWGINIRYMIPLVCRHFGKSNAQVFNIWFLVDTGSHFTCLTVKLLEALVGQGNATHDVYNISIQDQTAKIQCRESKAHFAKVNILDADAMQMLELSIEVDWKRKEFKLVKK